jgi:hypothetical protein
MVIKQTTVANGSGLVSVSVIVGFAAVVVPVVIVHEQVCPVLGTAVTVAEGAFELALTGAMRS